MKVGLFDLHAVCVAVNLCVPPYMAEPIFMKRNVYNMTPEPIWTTYFIYVSP
jgi:hypothetical protein